MVLIMEKLVTSKLEKTAQLTSDQRNLLSVAYKKRVEAELKKICTQILDVLVKLSNQNAERMKSEEDAEEQTKLQECQVFYLKMIGDYYRYLTEAFPQDSYKSNCSKYYEEDAENKE